MYPTNETPYSKNGTIDPVAISRTCELLLEKMERNRHICLWHCPSEIFRLTWKKKLRWQNHQETRQTGKALPARQQLRWSPPAIPQNRLMIRL